jgi:tRNA 2-thiouridine synthesizing protein C
MSEESTESGIVKKFMYLNRKAPYGTVYALESLEVVLIAAAFDQDVSLVFLDDGVYQIARGIDTKAIGQKNFSPTYKALGDYDINKIYVDKQSLADRGLSKEDILDLKYEDEDDDWAEKDSIQFVDKDELAKLMESQDVILSF